MKTKRKAPFHAIPFLDNNESVQLRFWLCVHIRPPQKKDLNENDDKNGAKLKRN